MPLPAPVAIPDPVSVTVPSAVEEAIELAPAMVVPPPVFEPEEPIAMATPSVGISESQEAPGAVVAVSVADGGSEVAQRAVVDALNAAKQGSAADAMEDAAWTVAGNEATIQTELSKTMLPVVMNPEADKIARGALRGLGIGKVNLLPGASAVAGGAAKKPKAARSGSVQAKALEHPMVQEAKRLFDAEIQTVIDLRER